MPCSQSGVPDPWVEASFPSLAGDSLVLDSRTIHCGGGRSPTMPSTCVWRVVAFATLVARPIDYDVNEVAFRPPWADQRLAAQLASAPSRCTARDCASPASRGNGCPLCERPLCAEHQRLGDVCSRCEAGLPVDGATSRTQLLGVRASRTKWVNCTWQPP